MYKTTPNIIVANIPIRASKQEIKFQKNKQNRW